MRLSGIRLRSFLRPLRCPCTRTVPALVSPSACLGLIKVQLETCRKSTPSTYYSTTHFSGDSHSKFGRIPEPSRTLWNIWMLFGTRSMSLLIKLHICVWERTGTNFLIVLLFPGRKRLCGGVYDAGVAYCASGLWRWLTTITKLPRI